MKINFIKQEKNKIIFELKGEDHTLANALRKELWNDKHIKAAGYEIEHPLIGIPRMVVETDGKENAKKSVIEAANRLKKINSKLKDNIKKEIE